MELTKRQRELLIACVEAELENNAQCDTALSLAETDGKDDPDAVNDALRRELENLISSLR